MTEPLPFVAYAFAYVGRQINSTDELNANIALQRQHANQTKFERACGRRILKHFFDWSTYRSAPFVSREKFWKAVEAARGAGADLLLADIRELMVRTKRNRIGQCAEALDALDIDVWDASLGRTWQSMTEAERRAIVITAAQTNKSRSDPVKAGIQLSKVEKAATENANYKKGNRANRNNADQRARRHHDFVLKEMAKVPAGETLSPSALATALNAAGVPSARGGSWSYNTAKDLIARVRSLPGEPPTT